MNADILSAPVSKYESRLNKCLSAVDVCHASPKDAFAGVDDEFWLWLNTHGYRQNVSLQQILPAMPDDVTQDRFTGLHGDANLASAFGFYKLVKQIAETNLRGLDRCGNILDFGCGWGRIIRLFLRDLAPAQIWGIDCLPEAIEICQATNRWCQFQLTPTMPPSGLPAASFGLVYAYSVFSHLSEDAHRRWLGEFHRILKPGGLLVLTTRDREFINYCEYVRKQSDQPFFAGGTASAFPRHSGLFGRL